MLIKLKDKRPTLNRDIPKSNLLLAEKILFSNSFFSYSLCAFFSASSCFSQLACLGILIRSITIVA